MDLVAERSLHAGLGGEVGHRLEGGNELGAAIGADAGRTASSARAADTLPPWRWRAWWRSRGLRKAARRRGGRWARRLPGSSRPFLAVAGASQLMGQRFRERGLPESVVHPEENVW